PLRSVDHRKIVVGLRKLRKVLREASEDVDRFLGVALLGEDHFLQEARLRIARLGRQRAVDALERRAVLAGFEKLIGVLEIVSSRGSDAEEGANRKGGDYLHCVIFSRPYVRVAF